jgi:hypothetical protein
MKGVIYVYPVANRFSTLPCSFDMTSMALLQRKEVTHSEGTINAIQYKLAAHSIFSKA